MFNLFKKVQQAIHPTVIVNEKSFKRPYPEIVEEIHKEFFSAGEQILKEANQVLSDVDSRIKDKGKLLCDLGFSNTQQAKQAEAMIGAEKLAKEEAKLVMYYSNKYPSNKFITESAVGKICDKYALVCGEVKLFTGFVPEDKLMQIKNFKVDANDVLIKTWSIGIVDTYLGREQDDNGRDAKSYGSLFRAEKRQEKLKICAPHQDMKTEGYERRGHHLVKKNPDPVVLQPVNGGYLIVAAWGDEASDELVMNPKHN